MTAPSPRGPFAVASLAVLLLAGACKDEPRIIVKADGGTSVVTGAGGAVVEAADDGKSLPVPTDLPSFAPPYPGARLTTRIGGAQMGDGGALLVFETNDPVATVSAYYDARAKDAGAKPSMVVTEADSAVRLFGGADGHARGGAMIAISRSDDGPGSEIVITSGMAKADVVRLEKKPDEWRKSVRMPVRLQ
jgi:hypothetical protein